jgi:DnaJ-class molecular chaperone
MNDLETCPECLGTGEIMDGVLTDTITCPLCKGKGVVTPEVAYKYHLKLQETLSKELNNEDREDMY